MRVVFKGKNESRIVQSIARIQIGLTTLVLALVGISALCYPLLAHLYSGPEFASARESFRGTFNHFWLAVAFFLVSIAMWFRVERDEPKDVAQDSRDQTS